MKIKTTNLPLKTIREAQGIAGGLYHMNATSSFAYGFNVARDDSISSGMFLDYEKEISDFDGVIFLRDKTITHDGTVKSFKTQTLLDMKSGETRLLKPQTTRYTVAR